VLVSNSFDRVFRPAARNTIHFAVTDAVGVPVDTLGRYPADETVSWWEMGSQCAGPLLWSECVRCRPGRACCYRE
jgi:hypothetical protein